MNGEMKRQDIQRKLGLKDREYFRKNYINEALDAKVIKMTIPDKPNSKNQRYRITELGLKILKAG